MFLRYSITIIHHFSLIQIKIVNFTVWCQVFKIPVVAGDVIVAGSDGLFDNLYNKEIAAIVGDAVKDGLNPGAMAEKIAAVARVRALDRKCRSPFSAAALQAGFAYYGGKLDDLTVVVSYVCN